MGVDNQTKQQEFTTGISYNAELLAMKSITQLVYPKSIMYIRSLLVTEFKDTKSRTTVIEQEKELPAPIRKKRIYCHNEVEIVCYVDLAVLSSDIEIVKKTGQPIPFIRDKQYYKLIEDNTVYTNRIIEKKLTILDKPHTFEWSPLRSQLPTLLSFGYNYSFLQRRFFLGYNYIQYNEGEGGDGSPKNEGTEFHDQVKHEFYIGIAIYKSASSTFNLQLGTFTEFQQKGIEDSYLGNNDYKEEQSTRGNFVGFKYLYFTNPNNKMGFKFDLNLENHSGEGFNKEKIEEQKIRGSAGLIWVF